MENIHKDLNLLKSHRKSPNRSHHKTNDKSTKISLG